MPRVWIGGDAGRLVRLESGSRAAAHGRSPALSGAIGVGIGAIVRGQALAIVSAFVWFLIVEPLVGGSTTPVGQRTCPGQALDAARGRTRVT